jgi:hypothetical protein
MFEGIQIHIFNICCLVAVCLSSHAVIHFWQNYKKTHLSQFKNLSFIFFFILLANLMLSLPGLILFDSFWVQIDFILVDLSFLGTGVFTMPVILSFSKKFSQFQKSAFRFLLFIFLVYTILNIFFFRPASPLFSDGILYYFKNGVFWLHSILWIPLTSLAGIFSGVVLNGAKKTEEKRLFQKSFLLGSGSFLVFVAGILFWYFKFFNLFPQILNISGIVGIFGFILGEIGGATFPPREILVKKVI